MAHDRRMDVQQLAGLTDQELIVYAIREATMMVCAEIEPGKGAERRSVYTAALGARP